MTKRMKRKAKRKNRTAMASFLLETKTPMVEDPELATTVVKTVIYRVIAQPRRAAVEEAATIAVRKVISLVIALNREPEEVLEDLEIATTAAKMDIFPEIVPSPALIEEEEAAPEEVLEEVLEVVPEVDSEEEAVVAIASIVEKVAISLENAPNHVQKEEEEAVEEEEAAEVEEEVLEEEEGEEEETSLEPEPLLSKCFGHFCRRIRIAFLQ